jgi:hypothetical protein
MYYCCTPVGSTNLNRPSQWREGVVKQVAGRQEYMLRRHMLAVPSASKKPVTMPLLLLISPSS